MYIIFSLIFTGLMKGHTNAEIIQWYHFTYSMIFAKKKTFINHSPVSSGVLFSSLHKRFVYLDIYLSVCVLIE